MYNFSSSPHNLYNTKPNIVRFLKGRVSHVNYVVKGFNVRVVTYRAIPSPRIAFIRL